MDRLDSGDGKGGFARGGASAEQRECAQRHPLTAGGDGGRWRRSGQVTGFADGMRAVPLLDGSHGAVEFAPFAGRQANRPLRWIVDRFGWCDGAVEDNTGI